MNNTELGFTHRFERGTRSETLLLLHGTGGDENDMIAVGRQLLPGANILSPRGKVLENGMPRFFRRLAIGVFDEENLKENTSALAAFVEQAAVTYYLNAGDIFAVGYSNGANIAASLLLLRPGVLAGAVLFRPMVPIVPETAPNLNNMPVLIAAAKQDPYSGQAETERLAALLEEFGAVVTVHWSPGGHGLTPLDLRISSEWLALSPAARSKQWKTG